MKNAWILQILWLLMLKSSISQRTASAASDTPRVVRSEEIPTELDVVARTLSQRLDAVEEENQALKNDLQTVQSKNAALERTMVDLMRLQHIVPATTVTPTATTVTPTATTVTPTATPVTPTTTSTTATTTAGPDDVSLETLKAQVEGLRERGDKLESDLRDLQNGTDLQAIHHELHSVGVKYQLVEQIVMRLKQETEGLQRNVTRLHADSMQQQDQLHDVTHMVATSQNVSSSIAALQTAVNDLVQKSNRQSQQNSLPAVAFDAYAGDAAVKLTNDATLVLPKILTNEGRAYNGVSGKAAITVEGLYLFLLSVELKGHEATLHIMVNGRSVTSSHLPATHSGPGHEDTIRLLSLQALVRLHSGDSVWVQASAVHHEGVDVQPGQGTSFMGLLLHE